MASTIASTPPALATRHWLCWHTSPSPRTRLMSARQPLHCTPSLSEKRRMAATMASIPWSRAISSRMSSSDHASRASASRAAMKGGASGSSRRSWLRLNSTCLLFSDDATMGSMSSYSGQSTLISTKSSSPSSSALFSASEDGDGSVPLLPRLAGVPCPVLATSLRSATSTPALAFWLLETVCGVASGSCISTSARTALLFTTRSGAAQRSGHVSGRPACSRLAKCWLRQVAQKLCPHGSSAAHCRSTDRQIWHCRSSSVVHSLVL
mmetsp:Transcript_5983/g.15150  ORF Transcript_5983/g.15150 Transcript_5983/m.15150 type:complete len:266 (-) Transcript_5983:67-864(-)